MTKNQQKDIFKRYLKHSEEMIFNATSFNVLNQHVVRSKTLYCLMNDLNLIKYGELHEQFLKLEQLMNEKTQEIRTKEG